MPKSRYSPNKNTYPHAAGSVPLTIRHVAPEQVAEPEIVGALQQILSEAERKRMRAFASDRHRHNYLVSHALKRFVIAQILGESPDRLTFTATETGKPLIHSPSYDRSCHFNISHSEGRVVVAVSQNPVGIDVENTSRSIPDLAIAKRFFAAREYSLIAAHPPETQSLQFFKHWTLKEAYLKAEGWGLANRLDAIAFDVSDPIVMTVLDPIAAPSANWRFWQTPLAPNHLLSVAYQSTSAAEDTVIDCRDWHPEDSISKPKP